jgi:hypothetical protein
MDRTRQDFEDSIIVQNLVARVIYATEFATPEAREEYLKEHPNADPSNHTVKKQTPKVRERTDHYTAVKNLFQGMDTAIDDMRKSTDPSIALEKAIDSIESISTRSMSRAQLDDIAIYLKKHVPQTSKNEKVQGLLDKLRSKALDLIKRSK